MSEQTANLCTTDACESLRARLAKYEDAEGNPISTIAEQARDIASKQATINGMNEAHWKVVQELAALKAQPDPWQASGADWCSSIHSNPDAKAWADFFVAVFPGQADKHELMIGWFANAMMAMHDHLKAQPSGVVDSQRLLDWNRSQPEPRPIVVGREYQVAEACARLNSSPVSAVCDTCHGKGEVWTGENQSFGYMSMQPPEPIMEACPECSGELVRPASAGDDRKLSDIGNELHNLSCHVVHHNEGWANQLGTLASELWNWQARATLTASAPSHGEQVRVPEGWTVERGYSPSGYVLHSPSGSMIRVCDSGMGGIETAFAMFLKALLAASPSAGSQGGDV